MLRSIVVPLDGSMFAERALPIVEKERGRHDAEQRRSRAWKTTAPFVYGAAVALGLVATLLVLRVGAFAMQRREPAEIVEADGVQTVRLNAPFDALEDAFDYVYRMQCPAGPLEGKEVDVPAPLTPAPFTRSGGLRRYQF